MTSSESNPEKLIRKLKKDAVLSKIYEESAGVWEGLTVEEHTLLVLRQFEKYFGNQRLPGNVPIGLFRNILAFHDVGKPQAIRDQDKRKQYGYTLQLLDRMKDMGHIDEKTWRLSAALINGDPIGMYLKGKIDAGESAELIRGMADYSKLPLNVFFKLLTIYYQSDVASYTRDAGTKPALDHLFLYDERNGCFVYDAILGRLVFSKETEDKFEILVKHHSQAFYNDA